MASNPMQRKTRNSFLLGIVVTLLITGVVIAFLLLMLKEKDEELRALEEAKVRIYTLQQDVKAGQTLTSDMFQMTEVNKNTVPSNATSLAGVIDAWFLQTKDGQSVCRDEYGLYLDKSYEEAEVKSIMKVEQDPEGKYFMDVDGDRKQVKPSNKVQVDEYGMFYIDTQYTDRIRVYKEPITDEYYIFKMNDTQVREKEYLDIKNVPVLARVDMNANTVMTAELVVQSDERITDDTRQEQYNMITLPVDLMTNDYVDIRLKVPTGQNFIVVSKALVEVPMNADGTYMADTIKVNLREDEILAMSSAIVEAYGLNGAELYVTKYVDPAMQTAADPTYTPNSAVTLQMQLNPNIVEIAKTELASRYSEAAKKIRNDYLQQAINGMEAEEYNDNISSSMEENMGSSLTSRQKYLESLDIKK